MLQFKKDTSVSQIDSF